MSWTNEMVRIVRFLVNDLDAASYTDDRLEETILVAAQLLYCTMDFDNTYTIDVDSLSLTPDPTLIDPKDNWFINLVCVKTSCIILGSETKTLAAQSYRITDGPATIDIQGAYKSTKEMYDSCSLKLEKMIVDYRCGNSIAGQAVLTPYTVESGGAGELINNANYNL
jgi:hypothetical protein